MSAEAFLIDLCSAAKRRFIEGIVLHVEKKCGIVYMVINDNLVTETSLAPESAALLLPFLTKVSALDIADENGVREGYWGIENPQMRWKVIVSPHENGIRIQLRYVPRDEAEARVRASQVPPSLREAVARKPLEVN